MRPVVLLLNALLLLIPLISWGAAEKTQIGQPLFCHGCVAVLKELHKVLKDSSGRKKTVTQSLDRLCQIDKFVSYTFSPPKMIKACNHIVETYRTELTKELTEYYRKYRTAENLPLQERVCDHVIKACDGVRRPTQDGEMKPHGLSMDEANQRLQDSAKKGFTPIDSQQQPPLQLEIPDKGLLTTPMPHEEL